MSPENTDHGDLCMACGLCCSGALFDHGRLDPEEADLPERTGISRASRDYPAFAIPCGRLSGTMCSIYAGRPNTCRRYRCEVLRRIDEGEIAAADGKAAIVTALELVAQIEGDARGTIGRLRTEAASDPQGWRAGEPADLAARAQRNLALIALERHLDRHFRKPHQKQVMES